MTVKITVLECIVTFRVDARVKGAAQCIIKR